jgi:hypothetical protein
MKEVTKEVYLKWYEDMFGESLKTNLLHYTYNKKVRGFLHYSSPCWCIACDGLDKRQMITAYRNHVQLSEWV